jgi:membrane-associated phospholipid phosphatase
MSARTAVAESSNYLVALVAVVRSSTAQLVRAPSHARRALAARRLARHTLLTCAIGAAAIVALMFLLDAWEIGLMPPRGAPDLWPVRILTEFGNDAYVLWSLAAALVVVALASAGLGGASRAQLLRLGTRLQYLFFAVLLSVLAAEAVKWTAGRGRPFVGGKANAFNFAPFTGTEAYFSFPSAHAVTAFALAFAVGAIWPRTRTIMFVYAVVIAITRLVLLAHHPSDVVAGALIGVVGAMAARYWFAARRLGFVIGDDGTIVPLPGHRFSRSKRVAGDASGP